MDLSKGRKSSGSSLPLWSRATTRLGIRRKYSSRPDISAPFGPVKNSRGPDFSRSDTLIVVDGIEDCAYSNLPPIDMESNIFDAKKSKLSPTTATRRLSAGFPQPPSAGSPTVARSNIPAATGIQAVLNRKSTNELRKASSTEPPQSDTYAGLKTRSTVSLLPHVPPPLLHDENTPPGRDSFKSDNTVKHRVSSRLPTSKTINVIRDLKDAVYNASMKGTTSLMAEEPGYTIVPAVAAPTPSYVKIQSPRSSQTSFLSPSVDSIYQDFDPQLITEAQPSAYWSGRFMSLHDKYSAEALTQRPPLSPVSTPDIQASCPRIPLPIRRNVTMVPLVTHLPHATSTSALLELPQAATPRLNPPPPPPAIDEDAQSRRIFHRLEALCTTDEARASLVQWQQAYARHTNRPNLLPEGGTMNNKASGKGSKPKWFSSNGQKSGRRNLSTWKEGGNHHVEREPPRRPVEMHHFRASLT